MNAHNAFVDMQRLAIKGGFFEVKSMRSYRLNLRESARALFYGYSTPDDYLADMIVVIRKGFRQAWAEGAATSGIRMNELTPKERAALNLEINLEQERTLKLAEFIEANTQAQGGKLKTVLARVQLWENAYTRIKTMATALAAGDKKKKWILHPAEHCMSCLKLSGKVKRSSFWMERGIYPKAWDKLECRFGCKCTLEDTDEPLTPGRLPNLP